MAAKRGSESRLCVSVGIVFSTFTDIRFTVYIFRTIVTPKHPTKVIEFRVKKETESLSVEIRV